MRLRYLILIPVVPSTSVVASSAIPSLCLRSRARSKCWRRRCLRASSWQPVLPVTMPILIPRRHVLSCTQRNRAAAVLFLGLLLLHLHVRWPRRLFVCILLLFLLPLLLTLSIFVPLLPLNKPWPRTALMAGHRRFATTDILPAPRIATMHAITSVPSPARAPFSAPASAALPRPRRFGWLVVCPSRLTALSQQLREVPSVRRTAMARLYILMPVTAAFLVTLTNVRLPVPLLTRAILRGLLPATTPRTPATIAMMPGFGMPLIWISVCWIAFIRGLARSNWQHTTPAWGATTAMLVANTAQTLLRTSGPWGH
mmetsp:Transcript_132959/g.331711  ORF Transcript_132959/g.331711 Transcript_132959/m.331711 type:complete len:313 (+) Transcript_132959:2840-3778(+)